MLGGKSIGQELIRAKRLSILGVQETIFPRRDGNDLFIFDLVNDIDKKPRMPAWGQDFRLWAFLPICRNDVLAGQRGGAVNLVEYGNFVRLDMDVRGRRETDERDDHEHESQRQRKRPEIRSRSVYEQCEDAWSYRRQYQIQNCNDNPKHRALPERPAMLAASRHGKLDRAKASDF